MKKKLSDKQKIPFTKSEMIVLVLAAIGVLLWTLGFEWGLLFLIVAFYATISLTYRKMWEKVKETEEGD